MTNEKSSAGISDFKVLVLAPHPDDETFACGGSVLLHSSRNENISVIVLTDGQAAEKLSSPEVEKYIQLRESEAKRAFHILGVSEYSFWRFQDQSLEKEINKIKCLLVDYLLKYKPNLIYAPSPFEIHPDHLATSRACWLAVQESKIPTKIFFYESNQSLIHNFGVDVSQVMNSKIRACDVYESQNKLYPYTSTVMAINKYRAHAEIKKNIKYVEAFLEVECQVIFSTSLEEFVYKTLMKNLKILENFSPENPGVLIESSI